MRRHWRACGNLPRVLSDPGFKFCPKCGTALHKRRLKEFEPERLLCPGCGYVMYLNPKVAAGAVVEHRGGIVLLRREIDPRAGFWVHPGGFVDRGETLEQAARRETREEVGLEVEIGRLLGAFSFADSEVVVVTFAAHVISGEPVVGDESLEVRTFAPHEIPWDELAFPSTRLALDEYLRTAGVLIPEAPSAKTRPGLPTASVPIPHAPSANTPPANEPTTNAPRDSGSDLRAAVAVSLALASSAAADAERLDAKQIQALFEARAAAHAARDVRAASLVYPSLIGHLRAARRHREALVIAEEGLALTHDPLIARLGDEVAHELAALEEERC